MYRSPVTETTTVMVTQTHTAGLARLGHALSDETRTRILLRLRESPAVPSDLAEVLATIKWYEVQGEVRWGHIRRGEQVDWKTCREAGVGQDSWMKGILKTVELSTDSTNGSCHFCLDWLLRLQRDQKQRQKQFANRFGHQGYGARA